MRFMSCSMVASSVADLTLRISGASHISLYRSTILWFSVSESIYDILFVIEMSYHIYVWVL